MSDEAKDTSKDTLSDRIRLSDRILTALELALKQEDLNVAEHLTSALELSMTRKTGGSDFTERRNYPEEMEAAMQRLQDLRAKTG